MDERKFDAIGVGGDQCQVDPVLVGQGVDGQVRVGEIERLFALQAQAARLGHGHSSDDAPGLDLLDLSLPSSIKMRSPSLAASSASARVHSTAKSIVEIDRIQLA